MSSLKGEAFVIQRMTGGDPTSNEEYVLAVPTARLRASQLLDDGFRWGGGDGFERVQDLILADGRFLPRSSAENDPDWKQIIPYAVVHCDSDVFLLRRSRRGGEPRLYDRLSIGVGGHINPEPGPDRTLVLEGLRRELDEELVLPPRGLEIDAIGTLNDDSNEVGRVHFGLVFLARASERNVKVREGELLSGEFVALSDLSFYADKMETWSQWVLRALEERPGALIGENPSNSARTSDPNPTASDTS